MIGRDSLEVVVAVQWTCLIGRAPNSIDESFFDTGGDSLMAARLVGALRKASGIPVPLEVVFDYPTVRGQGDWIRAQLSSRPRPAHLMTLRARGGGAPLVLLPGGGGSLVGLHEFGSETFPRPVHGLLAPGLAADEPYARTIEELSGHFRRVLEKSPLPREIHLGGFCSGAIFAHHLAGVLSSAGWRILSVSMLEPTIGGPDLTHDEVVRARLVQLAGNAGIAEEGAVMLTADALFAELRSARLDLLEADAAAFRRRLDVFASLWCLVAGYKPTSHAVPVAVFTSDPVERLPPRWRQVVAPPQRPQVADAGLEPLNEHRPTLEAVEKWIRAHETT